MSTILRRKVRYSKRLARFPKKYFEPRQFAAETNIFRQHSDPRGNARVGFFRPRRVTPVSDMVYDAWIPNCYILCRVRFFRCSFLSMFVSFDVRLVFQSYSNEQCNPLMSISRLMFYVTAIILSMDKATR